MPLLADANKDPSLRTVNSPRVTTHRATETTVKNDPRISVDKDNGNETDNSGSLRLF